MKGRDLTKSNFNTVCSKMVNKTANNQLTWKLNIDGTTTFQPFKYPSSKKTNLTQISQKDAPAKSLMDPFAFKYIFIGTRMNYQCTVFRVFALSNTAIWSCSLIVVFRQGQGSDAWARR